MFALKSLFSDVMYTKVEYVPNDRNGEKFHVYKKDNPFIGWYRGQRCKTLAEAEEIANSRADKVQYMGVFENGNRKGMTDWRDDAPRKAPVLPGTVPPPSLEVDNKYTRRKSRDQASVYGKESYKPVDSKIETSIRLTRQQ